MVLIIFLSSSQEAIPYTNTEVNTSGNETSARLLLLQCYNQINDTCFTSGIPPALLKVTLSAYTVNI